MMPKKTRLTCEEREYIKKHFPNGKTEDIAKKLGRPCGTIRSVAKRMGVKKIVRPSCETEKRLLVRTLLNMVRQAAGLELLK